MSGPVPAPEPGRGRAGADLRLFGVAAGAWGASLAALFGTARATIAGAAAAAAAAGVLMVAKRGTPEPAQNPSRSRVAAAVLLGVVCGALATAARTAGRDAEPLAGLARDRAVVRAEVTVTDDPRAVRPRGSGPATLLVPARLTRLDAEGAGTVRLDARVLVFASDPAWRSLLPGQRLVTSGRLAPARGGDLTAAVLQASGEPHLSGRPPWPQLAAGRLRSGLQLACDPLPDAPGGLLPGLVIGDTSRLDPALAEQFRATGLTHLVAVSGSNDRDQLW